MMRALLLALLALLPAAAADTGGYEVRITLAPATATVETDDVVFLTGSDAAALRACLDSATGSGYTNCPGEGDSDGTVEAGEVSAYEEWFRARLNREGRAEGGSGPCELEAGHTIRIDGTIRHPACSNVVTRWDLRGAEGSVASTAAILLDHTVRLSFGRVAPGDEHEVEYSKAPDEREDRSANARYRIELRPAAPWLIDQATVEPEWARERFAAGALFFSQDDPIEGEENAVTFRLQSAGAERTDEDGPAAPDDGDTPGFALGLFVVAAWLAALRHGRTIRRANGPSSRPPYGRAK